MTIIYDALRESQAQLYIAEADIVSLHTADPGTTGANEVVYVNYAQQSTTWVKDADGLYHTNTMNFSVPACELTHVCVRNTGGTIVDVLPVQEIFEAATTYSLALTYEQD